MRFRGRPDVIDSSQWQRGVGLFAIVTVVVFGLGMPSVGEEPPADPLDRVNAEFRTVYSRVRSELIADLGPIVHVSGDDLTLIRGDERYEVRVIPSIYHQLKSVAHVPLAVDLAMRLEGGPNGEAASAPLERLGELARAVLGRLDSYGFDAGQRARQESILKACLDQIDRTLRDGRTSETDRVDFARAMGPLVLENADDAARAAIDAYRDQLACWRQEVLTPEQWRRLRVVVSGGQMPRVRNLAVQTFAKLLNVPGESHRLIYAEALFDEPKAIALLGTHILDGEVSVDFFNDPIRMERDLLGDAAAEYLDELDFSP